MAHQFPSIQSFFHPEASQDRKKNVGASAQAGDGFTAEEVEAVLHPALRPWVPQQEYEEVDIGSLVPGYQRVTFMGRVINFYNLQTPSKMPNAAKGCFKVVVKDDTGALVVGVSSFSKIGSFPCLLIFTTAAGQALVRQHGLQTSPWSSRLCLDASYFQRRFELLHFAECVARHFRLSREG